MTYRAVLVPSDEGFAVSCPGLAGLLSHRVQRSRKLSPTYATQFVSTWKASSELTRGQDVRDVEIAAS